MHRPPRAVTDKLSAASLSEDVLDTGALGTRADHFRCAWQPDAIVERVTSWCRKAEHGGG